MTIIYKVKCRECKKLFNESYVDDNYICHNCMFNPYQQVDTYKKIYEKIKRWVIPNVNYMWLGVVALPADLYHLSDLSQRLLRDVK